jgi:hypothetical protein
MGCEHCLAYEQAEQEAAYQNNGTQGSIQLQNKVYVWSPAKTT